MSRACVGKSSSFWEHNRQVSGKEKRAGGFVLFCFVLFCFVLFLTCVVVEVADGVGVTDEREGHHLEALLCQGLGRGTEAVDVSWQWQQQISRAGHRTRSVRQSNVSDWSEARQPSGREEAEANRRSG